MQDADTDQPAPEAEAPEARLRAALQRLGDELSALPDPDSPDLKEAAVVRAEADALREEITGLRTMLDEAEQMVQALSRQDAPDPDGPVMAFPSAAQLAAAAAESLNEAEREAQSLREALKMLDQSYQLLKQSHQDAVAALAEAVPNPEAELAALRAARAAEAAELDILRGRLAALISSPESEQSDE